MTLGIVLLGLVGFALAVAVMYVMGRMASERKSATRRKQGRIQPFSGDNITFMGHS